MAGERFTWRRICVTCQYSIGVYFDGWCSARQRKYTLRIINALGFLAELYEYTLNECRFLVTEFLVIHLDRNHFWWRLMHLFVDMWQTCRMVGRHFIMITANRSYSSKPGPTAVRTIVSWYDLLDDLIAITSKRSLFTIISYLLLYNRRDGIIFERTSSAWDW